MRFFLMLLPICTTLATAQEWNWQNPLPQSNSLRAVDVIDANTVVCVGSVGTVLKSTDSGLTWSMVFNVGGTEELTGVSFVDANIGTVVGGNGLIIRTTDGGVSWTTQNSKTANDLSAVSFSDANTGTVVGSGGIILHTTNGGETWVTQVSGTTFYLYAVSTASAETGTAVGDWGIILRTTNGGSSWIQQTSVITSQIVSVDFPDPMNGWAVGEIGPKIIHTTDGGSNWVEQQGGTYSSLASVSFMNDSVGIAVSLFFDFLRTTDGGTTWLDVTIPIGDAIFEVSLDQSMVAFAVGNSGVIYRTLDAGASWSQISSGSTVDKHDVAFGDKNTGIVSVAYVYGGPNIFLTTNGGETWAARHGNLTACCEAVDFADPVTAVAVGGVGAPFTSGSIYRTTNAGLHWTFNGEVSYPLYGVHFADATTGTAVGAQGTIYRTTSGGASWFSQSSGTSSDLFDVYLTSPTSGVAVGGLVILRTTDSGVTWFSQPTPGGAYLTSVSFADENTGAAVGSSGAIARTIDGGATWSIVASGTTLSISDIRFREGSSIGAALAGKVVLWTTDAGLTWTSQTLTFLEGAVFSVSPTGDTGWTVVGSQGTILHSFTEPASGDPLAQFGASYGSTGSSEPNNPGALITIDPVTGAGTLVGPTGIIGDNGPSVGALAIKSTGEMYALSSTASSDLYTVNASTGAATFVANTGLLHPGDIVFNASDVLYAVDETNILYTVDPVTGVRTVVGATGVTLGGLACDPTDGTVYGSDNTDGIYTIDVTTGAATLVGTTGLGGNTPDILFDQAGNLFGVKKGTGGISDYIAIDKTTGSGIVIGSTGFVAVVGLASRVLITPPTIPCTDITSMAARCIGGGVKTIQVRVNLLNNIIHAGEPITIAIDESQYTSTIITNGTHSRANFSVPGWSVGDHVVSLVDPPGCLADKHATCVAGDGMAKADPYWDNDAEWLGHAQDIPQVTELLGNYPNPFNPSTNIQYALSEDAHVTLKVYNMLGQVVATLVDEPQTAGYKSVEWNGRNESGTGVASGIYIYRITAGNFTATKRMLFLK